MKVGDLVIMKSKPTSIGIVVGLYQDIYPRGLQGEEVLDMAMVHWWLGASASFEIHLMEVIG
jgi:hypothetical protein|tara:strand:+ start:818 stop:1003 length:186 start_codon:yes stop_codon:yes gene_type:complete